MAQESFNQGKEGSDLKEALTHARLNALHAHREGGDAKRSGVPERMARLEQEVRAADFAVMQAERALAESEGRPVRNIDDILYG